MHSSGDESVDSDEEYFDCHESMPDSNQIPHHGEDCEDYPRETPVNDVSYERVCSQVTFLKVKGEEVEAIVDTARHSTFVSEDFARTLKGPLNLKAGYVACQVAHISERFILGLCFLKKGVIDMKTNLLTVGEDTIRTNADNRVPPTSRKSLPRSVTETGMSDDSKSSLKWSEQADWLTIYPHDVRAVSAPCVEVRSLPVPKPPDSKNSESNSLAERTGEKWHDKANPTAQAC